MGSGRRARNSRRNQGSARDLPWEVSRFHPLMAAPVVEVVAPIVEVAAAAAVLVVDVATAAPGQPSDQRLRMCSRPHDGRDAPMPSGTWAAAGIMRAARFNPLCLSGLGFGVMWVGGAGSSTGWRSSPPHLASSLGRDLTSFDLRPWICVQIGQKLHITNYVVASTNKS
jgi:hypothetical protein